MLEESLLASPPFTIQFGVIISPWIVSVFFSSVNTHRCAVISCWNRWWISHNSSVLWLFQQQHLIELIRLRETEAALEFAQTQLAEQGEESRECLTEMERTLALLAFDNPEESPFGDLLNMMQRQKVDWLVSTMVMQKFRLDLSNTHPEACPLVFQPQRGSPVSPFCLDVRLLFTHNPVSNHFSPSVCQRAGVEWSESGSAGLWKQGVDPQTGETSEAAAVGTERAGPKEGEIPQNDWPEHRHHRGAQVKFDQSVTVCQAGNVRVKPMLCRFSSFIHERSDLMHCANCKIAVFAKVIIIVEV